MTAEVRDLRPDDEARWRELWAGYLAFYDHVLSDEVTAVTLRRLLAGEVGMVGMVAVDAVGHVTGLVHLVVHPGTWSTAPRCYLEDLFVDPGNREAGVGRALIAAARARATDLGCDELYWITAEDNAVARRLYDRVASLSPYVRYEIELA